MIKSFFEYINESFSGGLDTTGYAKDVIKITKKLDNSDDSYTEIRELEYNDKNKFDLVIQIKKTENPNFETDSHFNELQWEEINFENYGFAIDANTFIDREDLLIPEIIVTLIIDPSREPDLYKELEFKLVDIIAHELNHTNQIGYNREPFNTRPSAGSIRDDANTSFKYFMLPDEVESIVVGLYTRSKEEGIEIDKLFDKYLIPFVQDNKLTQKEYITIFSEWLKYTLENYPDAELSTSNPIVSKIVNSI